MLARARLKRCNLSLLPYVVRKIIDVCSGVERDAFGILCSAGLLSNLRKITNKSLKNLKMIVK